jgi:hypothetical protein
VSARDKNTDASMWPGDGSGDGGSWEDIWSPEEPPPPPLDIGRFYNDDPRRRQSEEVTLGNRWLDRDRTTYLLSWVHDTGELYLMRDMMVSQPRFGVHDAYMGVRALPDTVIILARIEGRDRLEAVLSGWTVALNGPNSVTWLCSRLSDAGVLEHDLRVESDTGTQVASGVPPMDYRGTAPTSPVGDIGPQPRVGGGLQRLFRRHQ